MPSEGSALGQVRLHRWTLATGGAFGHVVVMVPGWAKAGDRFPLLVALHGRGEARRGPEAGAMGWPRDYALVRAFRRVCAPPLARADFEGHVSSSRLAELNAGLAARPFPGLVVACPYLPDVDLDADGGERAFGEFVVTQLVPKARRELPVLAQARATGIDGVSLGGAVALRVGLAHPDVFGAVGSLQAALGREQIAAYVALAKQARARSASMRLRLLTSDGDYFRAPIGELSAALRDARVDHEHVVVPGPHDYPFNRGPGAIEMLLWHGSALAT